MNFTTIDFETADSSRESPCEVGLSVVRDGVVQEVKSWLIKPACYPHFNPFNVNIHGISPDEVRNAPTFPELWEELRPLVEGQFLIAHNAAFDMSVLRKTLEFYGHAFPELQYSCSYIFSKKVWEGLPSYGLKSLCRLHNIPLNHHRAGADSEATAHLSLKAFKHAGVLSLEDFPTKLRTTVGRLYDGGYSPSTTKREYSKSAQPPIVGDPAKANPESIFYGRTVVFTGKLSSMPRKEASQFIADIGGNIGNGVTQATDFLVIGQQDYRVVGEDGMSSKQKKAVKMIEQGAELEIMSEEEFLRCL